MAKIRDMLRRALGGRQPEDALAEFKEKLHHAINDFKTDPQSQERIRYYLRSFLVPLRYINNFIVRPHMADRDKLKTLAQQFNLNKIELKRIFKLALELEEQLTSYFGEDIHFEQLVITLRKVVNVLDEELLIEMIDAMDHNIDFDKIEKAYLNYQDSLNKAYNTEGLRSDLQSILGSFLGNFKQAFQSQTHKTRPSDKRPEIRMLEPALQNAYDHFREEGYTHDEAMAFVEEKRDLEMLPTEFMEAYRILRQEGRTHKDAIEYARSLVAKAQQNDGTAE